MIEPTDEVTIQVAGLFAWITSPCPDLLRPLLSYPEWFCQAGGPYGYRLNRRESSLCWRDQHGHLVTLAGLVPRIETVLKAQGRRVVVEDQTAPSPRLVADRQVLAGADDQDAVYLAALTVHPRGQVVVRNDDQLAHLVGLACRLFPGARALVVAATRSRVQSLTRRLKRRLRGQVATTVRQGAGSHLGARVLVTTVPGSPGAVNDTDPFDLVFFAAADHAVDSLVARVGQLAVRECKVIGFVRRGERRGEAANLLLEGACGHVVYEAPGPFGRDAGVRVVFAEPPWAPAVTSGTALEYKREAVWHNRCRNEAIATLARALADGGDQVLYDQGTVHPDVNLPLSGAGRRVVVLVETTEHGQALARLLPGWPLYSSSTAVAGSRLPETGLPARSILTVVAAGNMSNLDVDVLVWASAAEGLPQLQGFPPAWTEGRHQVIVVDLADDSSGKAEADTRRRLKRYAGRGWRLDTPPHWLRPRPDNQEDDSSRRSGRR